MPLTMQSWEVAGRKCSTSRDMVRRRAAFETWKLRRPNHFVNRGYSVAWEEVFI